MINTLKKVFYNYSQIIQKIFTFVGIFFIYFFGLSLSFILTKIFWSSKIKNSGWEKIDQKIKPEVMF